MEKSWLEINLSALKHNYLKIQQRVGREVKIMPIVKANAYGHGFLRCVQELMSFGANWLGVANLGEAALARSEFREAAILILGPVDPTDFGRALSGNFRLSIDNPDHLNFLNTQARIYGKRANIHIKVNTGMNRFGVQPRDAITLVQQAKSYPHIFAEGIYSHFYDSSDQSAVMKQWRAFSEVQFDLQKQGLEILLRHLANSEAIINFDKSYFEIVRPGGLLYGLKGVSTLGSQPVLSWKSRIVKIRRINRGECVSYGCAFKAKKEMDLGIVSVGYADGYPRALSGKAEMLVKGRRCRVVGMINMDYSFMDITPAMRVSREHSPQIGDEVILIGAQDKEVISAEEMGSWLGTNAYEITTRLPKELVRVNL